jgi:hypothetical protein
VAFWTLIACVATAVALTALAWASHAGATSHVSLAATVGWCLGAVGSLILFSWFRSSNLACQADRLYVDPSWRPARAAALAAVVGWTTGIACAVLIAASVARR